MCSIIGAFNKEKLLELVKLNQYRGNFSYSISVFDNSEGIVSSYKQFGEFNLDLVPEKKPLQYYIAHVQAPTGGLIYEYSRIHPSYIEESKSFLWHNGILKTNTIKELRQKLITSRNWDTYLLHEDLDVEGFEGLNNIDGSFGCIYIISNPKPKFYVFTSDIITLYIDNNFNLSSVSIPNSERIIPNKVYELDIITKKKNVCFEFNSKSSPYYFVD